MRSLAAAAARRARAAISIRLSALSRPHPRSLNDDVIFMGKRTRAAHRSALSITTTYLGGLAFSSSPNKPSKEERELTELFESWISKHVRVYKDAEEKQYRFNVFKDNLKYIDSMKNHYGPDRWIEGVDILSDMTLDMTYDEYISLPPGSLPSPYKSTAIARSNSGFHREESHHLRPLDGTRPIDVEGGSSTRSQIKVRKQGIDLYRCVDLTKLNSYDELIAELDQLFEFHGELMAPENNWVLVYIDDDNDMMLLGDDLWQSFCVRVWRIFIFTREEIQKMNLEITTPVKDFSELPDV